MRAHGNERLTLINRMILGVFFLTLAGLKLAHLFTSDQRPDIGGVAISDSIYFSLLVGEALLGLMILTKRWIAATWSILVLFTVFLALGLAESLGWMHTHHCGCLGPVRLNLQARILMSLGGITTCVALLWRPPASSRAPIAG